MIKQLVVNGDGVDPHSLSAKDYQAHNIELKRTAMQAIRAKCLDYTNDQQAEVRYCPQSDCPLWPLRMGSYPKARRG